VLGGVTSDNGFELYLTAWAATTGGVWFLFEKAETALGDEVRTAALDRLANAGFRDSIESLPQQFAALFDRVFGERIGPERIDSQRVVLHGFERSSVASICSALIVGAVTIATTEVLRTGGVFWVLIGVGALFALIFGIWPSVSGVGRSGMKRLETYPSWIGMPIAWALLFAVSIGVAKAFEVVLNFFGGRDLQTEILASGAAASFLIVGFLNLVFDYQSLIVTRRLIECAATTGRLGLALLIDFVVTFAIWLTPLAIFLGFPWATENAALLFSGDVAAVWDGVVQGIIGFVAFPLRVLGVLPVGDGLGMGGAETWILRVSLLTTFFTSMWLWLYIVSVLISQVLLRMNNGVGFLLRVTDVERQPFRSMGFVGVIIVSGLFMLGLPLVLL